jgi:transposase-like protein
MAFGIPTRRLSDEDKAKIIRLYSVDGVLPASIATRFGMSGRRIRQILHEAKVPKPNRSLAIR